MSELVAEPLLETSVVVIHDVCCDGRHAQQGDEECATVTHLVFPYRGVFVRHLGRDQAVGEANQVLFFNGGESYRVSHPVAGGDACLDVVVNEAALGELAPKPLLNGGATPGFRQQRLRIDARTQALGALLRHRLRRRAAEPLEAESLALTLAKRALGLQTTHAPRASAARQRLVDRTRLVIASDPSRRWTLAEIAADVGHSPVYLTQVFQQVEGLPLYRYQLRLRLARALDLLPEYDDLTTLGLDLGFSSHSHFSTTFAKAYGCSPSAFRNASSPRRERMRAGSQREAPVSNGAEVARVHSRGSGGARGSTRSCPLRTAFISPVDVCPRPSSQ
jgi:AraC family transcriptional regulator